MIRFVDIRNNDTGYSFAFFDTINDKFIEINGEQVWESDDDFKENYFSSNTKYDLTMFLRLMPDWTKNTGEL